MSVSSVMIFSPERSFDAWNVNWRVKGRSHLMRRDASQTPHPTLRRGRFPRMRSAIWRETGS